MNFNQVCNYRLLENTSDSFVDRIESNISSSISLIESQLHFLDREEIEKNKNFDELYEKCIKITHFPEFTNFVENCKIIHKYYEEIEPITQKAVYMLLEKVNEKLILHIKNLF